MTDIRCALAPAGVSVRGPLVVRPATGGTVPPARPRYAVVRSMTPFDLTGTALVAPTAPFQGTGLPIAGPDDLRTDNQHTLGIHPPGRPQS